MTFVQQAFAPGKLFLAGEYAVVEPGRQAVLVAVERGITATVQAAAQPHGRVFSSLYESEGRIWQLQPDGLTAPRLHEQHDVAFAAMRLVDARLRQHGLPRLPYDLHLDSNLNSPDGRKYGLGSSAAVSVASLRALHVAFGLPLDDETLIKLALLAGLGLNPNGSGGDVAASVLGGWLHYSSPDRGWLRTQQHLELEDLLAQPWPGLLAQRLPAPACVQLLVGWTGTPASTTQLVAAQRSPVTADLLDASDTAVQTLVQAIRADDCTAMQQALRQAREAVAQIAQARGRTVDTERLLHLRHEAERLGAAAKTSGAGGGDCGIALLPAHADPQPVFAAWREHGIEPLDLKVTSA